MNPSTRGRAYAGKIIVKCTTARCDGYLTVGGTSLPAHTGFKDLNQKTSRSTLPCPAESNLWSIWLAFRLLPTHRVWTLFGKRCDHGYIEGQNILIETRHEGRDLDRLPEHAAELVGQKPQVFVAVTTNAALAAKAAAAGADYAENGCLMA